MIWCVPFQRTFAFTSFLGGTRRVTICTEQGRRPKPLIVPLTDFEILCTSGISFSTSCRSLFCQFPRLWTGFPNGSAGRESAYNAGDSGDSDSIPGSESSPGGENGNPLQYSCLKKKKKKKPHRERNLLRYSRKCYKKSDTTEYKALENYLVKIWLVLSFLTATVGIISLGLLLFPIALFAPHLPTCCQDLI